MNKKKVLIRVLIIFTISFLDTLFLTEFVFSQEVSSFPAAIHIQSNFSDGKFTIEQLVEKAKEKNIKILVITDTLLRRWEYGIWPLRNLIKRRVEENSVMKRGINEYLKTIKETQNKNPDIILLHGIEVIPFYYWKGNIFKGNLMLYDWHKQLLVIGLETTSAYKYLPIVTNRTFLPIHWQNLIQLWPIFIFVAGFFVLRFSKNFGYICIFFGLLFLFNNIPFRTSRYDQYRYRINTGIGPYQDLMNYVNKNNGLVFWTHPEASYSKKIQNISVITHPYKYDLWKAKDYTGFASLYYDNITVTKPGDLWDQILWEYCQGKRKKPVWGFGEIDYDGNTFKELDGIQTIFLLREFNTEEALKALRSGKIYAKLNQTKNDFFLTKFIISDADKKITAGMGDEIVLKDKPKISIEANCSSPKNEEITLRLIRNGKVINSFSLQGPPYSVELQDDYYQANEKIFYRLEIESNFCRIISNPIFVRFSEISEYH